MKDKINWAKFNAISMRFGLPPSSDEINCLTIEEIDDFNRLLNVIYLESLEVDYLIDAAKRRFVQKVLTSEED